jgi:hypothetical protein
MSDFVEQCRAEWKRLGVPDPLAEEMATDLTSDLAAAEADGVSAEEFLGSSYFDPRSFASSWAKERGVIPDPPLCRGANRRPRLLFAFTALAALTVIVTTLLLLTGQPKVSLVATKAPRLHGVRPPAVFVLPPGTQRQVVASASASAPVEWILLFLAVIALGFAAWLWANWHRSRLPTAPA